MPVIMSVTVELSFCFFIRITTLKLCWNVECGLWADRAAAAACVVAVDADEIRRLGKRFRKLDLDNSGALSIDEFMSLPELQQNPLVQRVIDIFDADGNGEVSPFPLPITFRAPPSSRSVFFYSSISGCRA